MKVGLVIPIYNRPEYVKQCFDSLLKLTVKPDLIVLVDDASTDNCSPPDFATILGCNMTFIGNEANKGVRYSLQRGIESAFKSKCDIVINLDSDAIVKPDFIERLTFEHITSRQQIVSGFNCVSNANPMLTTAKSYCEKAYCNGINMCFNRKQYETYIKPNLLRDGNWDYNTSLACNADNLPFIITTPSVVQHIGMVSSMGHTGNPDRAQDFKMLELPDVTLFGIDSHDIPGIQQAASISQQDIQFAEVNIITDNLFGMVDRRRDYSEFMLKKLAGEFNTSHVLTIHADGYVVNWEAWHNEWLQYDYIGASWGYKDGMNVGNGGFSLRSKRLCEILAKQNIAPEHMHPEDHCICRTYRESLEKDFGIKFAPAEVSDKFSIEAYGSHVWPTGNLYSGQFGFHGPHVAGLPIDKAYTRKPVQQMQVQMDNRPDGRRHYPYNTKR